MTRSAGDSVTTGGRESQWHVSRWLVGGLLLGLLVALSSLVYWDRPRVNSVPEPSALKERNLFSLSVATNTNERSVTLSGSSKSALPTLVLKIHSKKFWSGYWDAHIEVKQPANNRTNDVTGRAIAQFPSGRGWDAESPDDAVATVQIPFRTTNGSGDVRIPFEIRSDNLARQIQPGLYDFFLMAQSAPSEIPFTTGVCCTRFKFSVVVYILGTSQFRYTTPQASAAVPNGGEWVVQSGGSLELFGRIENSKTRYWRDMARNGLSLVLGAVLGVAFVGNPGRGGVGRRRDLGHGRDTDPEDGNSGDNDQQQPVHTS